MPLGATRDEGTDVSNGSALSAYIRAEELTLPLLEELIGALQWRVNIMKHRVAQEKVGWPEARNLPDNAQFEGVPIENRDRTIRRLLRVTLAVLEAP